MSVNAKEYAGLSKIKSELDKITKSIKKPFGEFYRNNIGEIDKTKSISLQDYVIMQDTSSLGSATIRLHKNKYILQKESEDGTCLYVPFEKKRTPIIPSDDESEHKRVILDKYMKYKPLTKKQLLERIYDKYVDVLKENKVTKKSFFDADIEDTARKLSSIGIDDLEQALYYYTPVKNTTKRVRSGINSNIVESSSFYEEFKELKDNCANLPAHDALFFSARLYKRVEKEYNKMGVDILLNISPEDNDEFVNVSTQERLECRSIPQGEYVLGEFFKKEVDMDKVKRGMYSGALKGIEEKSTFVFYEPCENLSELIDRFSSLEYAKSMISSDVEYDINDVIEIGA